MNDDGKNENRLSGVRKSSRRPESTKIPLQNSSPPNDSKNSNLKSSNFLTFVYNHNPFYVISVCIVLYGLATCIPEELEPAYRDFITNGALIGYSVVLSIVSYVIVRVGKVWDDARTIFLILILLFSAMSINLDTVWLRDSQMACVYTGVVSLVIVSITEGILRSLRINLPRPFRVSYYLLLAIGLYYPSVFPLIEGFWPAFDTRFLIILFPIVAAAGILSLLIPAVKGSGLTKNNGTPWQWPLYPYSLFVMLIFYLFGRTTFLSISFQSVITAQTPFAPFLWIPIFLASLFVIQTIAVRQRLHSLSIFTIWFAPICLLCCTNYFLPFSYDPIYQWTLTYCGSPAWMAVIGLFGFYLLSTFNRVSGAEFFLSGSLLALIGLQTDGSVSFKFTDTFAWPIPILIAILIWTQERRGRSLNWIVSSFGFVCFAAKILFAVQGAVPNSNDVLFLLSFNEAIVIFAGMMSIFFVSLAFDDYNAKWVRAAYSIFLPFVGFMILVLRNGGFGSNLLTEHLWMNLVLFGLFFVMNWLAVWTHRSKAHFFFSFFQCIFAIWLMIPSEVNQIPDSYRRLILILGLGILFLAVGVWVSLNKAGFGKRKTNFWKGFVEELSILHSPIHLSFSSDPGDSELEIQGLGD